MNTLLRSAFLLLLGAATVAGNALDDYVWKPDDNYKWVDMGAEYSFRSKVGSRPYTAYTLNMTSQRWLTDSEFSAGSQSGSIWWHYLVVIVPDNLQYTRNGTIWITGCDQGHIPNQGDEDVVLSAALATNIGTVTGVLFQIPNEHTIFTSDPIQKSRSEDSIIAFTWDHFLKDTSDPTWLLRFPMVKASLRAMDTIRDYTKQKRPELGTSLDYFIVSGASKRGWTTWDVGAVDKERVMGIVPVVLDAINFADVEHHQFRSYGGWSYALSDYVDMNITVRFDDPNMEVLQSNVDPYWYKDRLTMPKLVVNAGMDEFQQPDDTNYWWNQMPEPKKFMMIANAEHSLATGILEAVPGIGAWAHSLLRHEKMPEFTWTIDQTTGDITATVEEGGPPVHKAVVWWASSCGVNTWDNNVNRRDYRIAHLDNPCSCGPISDGMCVNLKTFWNKKELEMTRVKGKRTYTAHMEMPTDGTWTAFFIELKFVARKDDPTFEQLDLENIKKHIKFDDSRMTRGQRAYKVEFERKYPNWAGFPKDIGGFFDFTTQVSVIPNTFPYPDCTGEGCGYRLV